MANNYNQYSDNSDVWFDLYGAEGDMQPEEMELRRKQAQINALRERGMEAQEGKMVGNTYVAPSFTQYAAQLANAYMGKKGQEGVDKRVSAQDVLRKGLRSNLTGAFNERYGRQLTPQEELAEEAERMKRPINS